MTIHSRCLHLSWFFHGRLLTEKRCPGCWPHQLTTPKRITCGRSRRLTLPTMISLHIKFLATCECRLLFVMSLFIRKSNYFACTCRLNSNNSNLMCIFVVQLTMPCSDGSCDHRFEPSAQQAAPNLSVDGTAFQVHVRDKPSGSIDSYCCRGFNWNPLHNW